MRFPNPFRRRGDEDGGMVDSGVGIGDGDSVSDGDSVAGGNGERAQMERLREEVDSLRTEVLHINEAVRFTLASQNPRKSSAVGSFVRKAIGVASGAVGDAVAAAMEGAVVDVDAKPSAWTVVLERIDRELGGLSPAEATLLRTAWDETADLWQKSRAELIEFKTKLDEQAGDEASAQAAAQEIEELVEMLALPIDLSQRIGSVDALSFASQLVAVMASTSAGLPAQESSATTSFAVEPPPFEPELERQLALVRVATVQLVMHNEAGFRALRGEPPAESEDELLSAFALSIVVSVLQSFLAALLAFWLAWTLFGGVVWLVDRFVIGGVDSSAFGQLLDAAQSFPM